MWRSPFSLCSSGRASTTKRGKSLPRRTGFCETSGTPPARPRPGATCEDRSALLIGPARQHLQKKFSASTTLWRRDKPATARSKLATAHCKAGRAIPTLQRLILLLECPIATLQRDAPRLPRRIASLQCAVARLEEPIQACNRT